MRRLTTTLLVLAVVLAGTSAPASSLAGGESASVASPIAACTFVDPVVTPYPANGAADVPRNARIVLKHFTYAPLAENVRVLVAGSAVDATFVPIGEQEGLHPGWTAVDPAAALPAGADVTVVVGTGAGLAAVQTTAFQVGSSSDSTAPSGGEILAVETFVGGELDGNDLYGWSVALNEANDTGGPAWIRLEIVTSPAVGGQTTDTRVVEGSTYGIDGGTTSCSTALGNGSTVTITAQAFDLAGNGGPSSSRTFEVGPAEEDEGLCSVARVGGTRGAGMVGALLVAAFAASGIRVRNRNRSPS